MYKGLQYGKTDLTRLLHAKAFVGPPVNWYMISHNMVIVPIILYRFRGRSSGVFQLKLLPIIFEQRRDIPRKKTFFVLL